jgi:hypothetical protein
VLTRNASYAEYPMFTESASSLIVTRGLPSSRVSEDTSADIIY